MKVDDDEPGAGGESHEVIGSMRYTHTDRPGFDERQSDHELQLASRSSCYSVARPVVTSLCAHRP